MVIAMLFTEIETAPAVAAVRFASADKGKAAVNFLVAPRKVTDRRDAIPYVSSPAAIVP
jgi:hypothetical protein